MSAPVDAIEAGDWVVAGTTEEDRDVGKIVALDDATQIARVEWTSGATTDLDVSAEGPPDVEVFSDWARAARRREELDVADAEVAS